MIIIRVLSIAAVCVGLLISAEKVGMTAKVTVAKEDTRDPGYYTVEKDTVHITSANGTIDLVLPRVGKDATGKERPRDFAKEAKINYPVTSDEWNQTFISWMWRVQHVTDAGHVPTKAEMDAEWIADHPAEGRLK